MKKILLTLAILFAFLPIQANASTCKAVSYQVGDTGWYKAKLNLAKKTATITSCPNDYEVVIESYIFYGNDRYKVASVNKNALKKCSKTEWLSYSCSSKTFNLNLKYCKKLKHLDIFSNKITKVDKSTVKYIAKGCKVMCFDQKQKKLLKKAIPSSKKVRWMTVFTESED